MPRALNRYDYIVVGAGSAGCVLAARLSEDPHTSVLLLEAGGSGRKLEIQIPAAFYKLFRTRLDWAYFTEPQAALAGRRLFWPRGKVLGGSSAINAMIYIRGHRSDYDRWAALGNPGWSYAEVLPLFKKSESNERGASEFHGTAGPLNVADLRVVNPLSRAFVEAAVEFGLPRNADFNGAEQPGVGIYQVTQKSGQRHSAADAFLAPARRRSNLTIVTGAHAARVALQWGRAVGVEYFRAGRLEKISAEREVILAAGAIGSPQLLLLSGIGPADHLKQLGIAVAVDLPGVGQNLQDHLFLPVAYESKQPVSLNEADTLANLAWFLLFHRGPLTSNIAEAGGFLRTHLGPAAPDLQLHFGPVYYLEHGLRHYRGHGFTLGPTLIRPQSRGAIRLRSADPVVPPAIDPQYFSEESDLRVLVEGVKICRQIAQGRAFDAYRSGEVKPGASVAGDAAIAEYVRGIAETCYHPVGTCKMGNDAMAVVDAELRVRGVAGLRVADASIMPVITGGNTNAPTMMIAEKAAALIRSSR